MLYQWLALARQTLESVHPAFPWVLVTFASWAAVYGCRRWAPEAWSFLEKVGPSDATAAKVFQAMPSVLFGALASVALTGGDYHAAAKGAAMGALAPLLHHTMKAYRGAVGG